ncbi:MAG: ElyC/SanA/YdcF family protein [Candidatus Omnitrophota bacterium]
MRTAHKTLRIISLLTVCCFLITQIGWSALADGGRVSAAETPAFTAGMLQIPAELGQVTEMINGDSSAPAIIHIQSAHGNYQAEKNIENLLGYIEESSSVRLILLEGAAHKLQPELFRIFPKHPDFNHKVTDKLMQEGYLTGPESFLIGSAKQSEGWGMEDLDAYKKDRDAFISVVKSSKTAQAFLMKLRTATDKRFASKLNKDLLTFVHQEEAFGSGTLSFEAWLKVLGEASKKHLKQDLSDAFYQDENPFLIRYYRLQAIGSKIDREKAHREAEAFLKDLAARKVSTEILGNFKTILQIPDTDLFKTAGRTMDGYSTLRRSFDLAFEKLPKDFSMKAWPNWALYSQHIILMQEMESKGLHEEAVRLKNKIQTVLAKTPDEKEYLTAARELYLLKQLFSLELTRTEYEELNSQWDSYLGAHTSRGTKTSPESLVPSPEAKDLFVSAMSFYSTAIVREQHMFTNALKRMGAEKQNRAVIVTGGFHADGLKKLAASKSCSYLQITPRINEVSKRDHEVYLRSILGSRDLEISQMGAVLGSDLSTMKSVLGAQVKSWVRDVREIVLGMINSETISSRPALSTALSQSFLASASAIASVGVRAEIRQQQPTVDSQHLPVSQTGIIAKASSHRSQLLATSSAPFEPKATSRAINKPRSIIDKLIDKWILPRSLPPGGKADYIVGLNCSLNKEGGVNTHSRAVAEECVKLYRAGVASRVIFSGGYRRNGISEAEAMRRVAIEMFPKGEKNFIVDNAPDIKYGGTAAQVAAVADAIARNSEGIDMQEMKVVLVSQYLHARRANAMLKSALDRYGIGVWAYPAEKSSYEKDDIHFQLRFGEKVFFVWELLNFIRFSIMKLFVPERPLTLRNVTITKPVSAKHLRTDMSSGAEGALPTAAKSAEASRSEVRLTPAQKLAAPNSAKERQLVRHAVTLQPWLPVRELAKNLNLSLGQVIAYLNEIASEKVLPKEWLQSLSYTNGAYISYIRNVFRLMLSEPHVIHAFLKSGKVSDFGYPKVVELHMGLDCPGNCLFCYRRNKLLGLWANYMPGKTGFKKLKADEYRQLITDFADHGVEEIKIAGGLEPMTDSKGMKAVIDTAAERGIKMSIYTTGLPDHWDELEPYLLKVQRIRFSMNAATPTTYAKVVNPRTNEPIEQTFKKVCDRVQSLRDKVREAGKGPEIGIHMLLVPQNYKEMSAFYQLGKDLDADFVNFSSDYVDIAEFFEEPQKEELLDLARDLYKKKNGRPQLILGDAFSLPYGREVALAEDVIKLPKGKTEFSESMYAFEVTVDPFGQVYAAPTAANPGLRELDWAKQQVLGNLHQKGGLGKVIENARAREKKFELTDTTTNPLTRIMVLALSKMAQDWKDGISPEAAFPFKTALDQLSGSKQTEVAIIGMGRWGGGPLLNTLTQLPGVRVHGVARSNYSGWLGRKDLGGSFTLHHADRLKREILDNPAIKAVIITTQSNTHYEMVKEALLAGKDVFVEKPFTKTEKEAKELIAIAKEHKRLLVIGYEYVYDQNINRLKAVVENAEAGEVFEAEFNMLNPVAGRKLDTSENVIGDLASHMLSVVRLLFGEKTVTDLKAVLENAGEKADIFFNYGGIRVTIHVDRDFREKERKRTITIKGSRLEVTVDYQDYKEKGIQKEKFSVLNRNGNNIPETDSRFPQSLSLEGSPATTLQLEFKHFFEALKTRDSINSAESTLWISGLVEQINRLAAGSTGVSLEHYLKQLNDAGSEAVQELKILYQEEWDLRRKRLMTLLERFKKLYPHIDRAVVARAPGRITLNDHTDSYSALSLGIPTRQDDIVIAGINSESRQIDLNNINDRFPARSFDTADIQKIKIQPVKNKSELSWSTYALAVLQSLLPRLEPYPEARIPEGMALLVDGREEFGGVPVESNISSSAAFAESIIYAVEALSGIGGRMTGGEAIQIGRDAELKIGFPCGPLDQASSTLGRLSLKPGQTAGAMIDTIPRTYEDGRDKVEIKLFQVPANLEALIVDTGSKGEAQKGFTKRVAEGELASWILAHKLYELIPDFSNQLDRIKIQRLFADINRDHNGRPYLFEEGRLWPIFLKPAFFSKDFLGSVGAQVSSEAIHDWVRKNLPSSATKRELIDRYGMPEDYFEKVVASTRHVMDPDTVSYDLQGVALHVIGAQDRAHLIVNALADAAKGNDAAQNGAWKRFAELEINEYESLRDFFNNSTPRIDEIASWAMRQPWCLAPRHFGAGYGGRMQIWIRPGSYEQAAKEVHEFLASRPWYQGKADIIPFRAGAAAGYLGQNEESNNRGVSMQSTREIESRKLAEALARKYSAVIFDIDGTLTDNKAIVPDEMTDRIINLIKRNIYVVLISGRTQGLSPEYAQKGSHSIEEVVEKIRASLDDSDKLEYLLGLEQNGAVGVNGFRLGDSRRREFDLGVKQLEKKYQEEIFNELHGKYSGRLLYPEYKSHGMAVWIREEYRTKEFIAFLAAEARKILISKGLDLEVLSTSLSVDIAAKGAKKDNAIRALAEFFNIPERRIATVGDQGSPEGNDYSMLERRGGFNVGEYSSPDSLQISLPVAKELKGAQATAWIMDNLNFVPDKDNSTIALPLMKKELPDSWGRSEVRLTVAERAEINEKLQIIANYLAAREEYLPVKDRWTDVTSDDLNLKKDKKNVVMVFGSYDERVPDEAADKIMELKGRGYDIKILTSGEGGTKALVKKGPDGKSLTEAEFYAQKMEARYPGKLSVDFVEKKSKNTGQNVTYSRTQMLEEKGEKKGFEPQGIVVMQNPLFQRRAGLTLVRQYSGGKTEKEAKLAFLKSRIRLISYAPYLPEIAGQSDKEVLRDLEYALNEIKILRKDYPENYAKRGFTISTRVPENIKQAAEDLNEIKEQIEAAKAAVRLFDHVAVSDDLANIPKDPVVVVLGNPLPGYPAYVANILKQLNPSKILIVGNGVNGEDLKKGVKPEWQRIRNSVLAINPKLKDKLLVFKGDRSMNTGQNIVPVISILNREGLSPAGLVLVQAPQGLLVSQRIFQKQWAEKKVKASFTPVFYTYALPEYVDKVKTFLRTGDPTLGAKIMYFQKGEPDALQGLLKDIVRQIYNLRTWNEWGSGFIKFHEKDLSDNTLQNEAVLSQYLGSSVLSFRQNEPVVKVFDLAEYEPAFSVREEAFERSPLRPDFRQSRASFDRVNNEVFFGDKPVEFQVYRQGKSQRLPRTFKKNYEAQNPGKLVMTVLPNGNLGMNDWFVAIADGKVYHYRGDKLNENRQYDMLVVTPSGETKTMTLHFMQKGVRGIFDESGKNVAANIRYGIYGQPILKNGRLNLDRAAVQFDDMRHLLRFPMFKRGADQIHLGISDHKGELYTEAGRTKARQALQGKPVDLDLAPLRAFKITAKERDVIFENWGYRNVTEQKSSAKDLALGEYLVEKNKLWIRFYAGTHPHSFFGVTKDGKFFTGVVPGETHYAGTTLEALAEKLKTGYNAQDVFLWGNGKDTFMQAGDQTFKVPNAYGKGFSAVMAVKKPASAATRSETAPVRAEVRTYERPVIPQLSLVDASSLSAKIGTALRVAANMVSPLLSNTPVYASEIAPQLFVGTVHYQKAPVVPAVFAAKWPVFNNIIRRFADASPERMVIDQRQGIPDAASVLPLVIFARYNPKAAVVLALIADAQEVTAFERALAALDPNGSLPTNFKIQAFTNENEFVAEFQGFYNSSVPFGRPVALVTDREDSVVTAKIGSRKNLLSVVGAQNPLKQTASALLAADKLLDESIWSMGYHFVFVEKLGGLEALMAELTNFAAAQARMFASA